MPPSPHSQTTHGSGAHKDSDQIAAGDSYQLGEYTFTIQNVVSEGERVIQAHCSGPNGNAAHGITVPTSTQLSGWHVEANGNTADIYCTIIVNKKGTATDKLYPGVSVPFSGSASYSSGEHELSANGAVFINSYGTIFAVGAFPIFGTAQAWAMPGPAIHTYNIGPGGINWLQGKPIYIDTVNSAYDKVNYPAEFSGTYDHVIAAYVALYGDSTGEEIETEDVLLGRFPIDIVDAGGVGPDSDWGDPGDYDYNDYPDPDEREPDDPTYTLNLNATGALSGRHNDPLNDTSYSYVPADKATVKPYGCGGDGGHGGGGGAGASTVVVHKFATSRADSKEITALAKRHGYGSGGGKGGKGGDGMVLIYY